MGCSSAGSETDFEEGFSLAWRIGLARAGAARTVRGDKPKSAGSVVETVVRPRTLPNAANLHAVEDVEELHSQLSIDVLPKEEAFGYADVFVGVERIAQLANYARFVAHCEARVGERG